MTRRLKDADGTTEIWESKPWHKDRRKVELWHHIEQRGSSVRRTGHMAGMYTAGDQRDIDWLRQEHLLVCDFYEEDTSEFDRKVWAWFMDRAQIHDVYSWNDFTGKVADHLRECGIDIGRSKVPDLGTVSEFADTESPNNELPAIVASKWICNCGDYGTGSYYPEGMKWHDSWTLGISGPYALAKIIRELTD